MNRVVLRIAVLMGLVLASMGKSPSNLRAGDSQHGGETSNVGEGGYFAAVVEDHNIGRSLKSTRDPQCNLPEDDPCTLSKTAIGMVESGFATYYDEDCAINGDEGCYTDGVAACRTCYLSTDVYMDATNTTEASRPDWAMCPCCVPTTLEDNHVDIEVQAFNFTIFGISESACTDAPTIAPAPAAPTASTEAPVSLPTSPPVAAATPEPSQAAAVPDATSPTPAPVAGSRALESPAPAASAVTTPSPFAPTDPEATAENIDSDEDDGLSLGVKIGIGVGAAVGVICLGAAGFGVMKASRGSPQSS